MENEKRSDSDHEIMILVEKNVGTPAILGRAPERRVHIAFTSTFSHSCCS
jgi:hypothetical protein